MYNSIKGIYENGMLTLLEPAPDVEKSEVVITFLTSEPSKSETIKKRVLGGLKYLGGSIPDDFNDPIEDFQEYM